MKKISSYILSSLVMVSFALGNYTVHAQDMGEAGEVERPESAFREMIVVEKIDIKVPTVVSVPIYGEGLINQSVLIRERETDRLVGGLLNQSITSNPVPVSITTIPANSNSYILRDELFDQGLDFPVPSEGDGVVVFEVRSGQPITTSQLNLYLDQYVALPRTIEIQTAELGSMITKTLVAKKALVGTSINFPEVTSNYFKVILTYAQPLRVNEISFVQKGITDNQRDIRFLAQPDQAYDIYYNPDQSVIFDATEIGNLRDDRDIFVYVNELSVPVDNPYYKPADVDDDGVVDLLDNCVSVSNSDQVDVDRNGRGDMCDDWDRDGFINTQDNCPTEPNLNQSDADADGVGDVCDGEESRFTESNPWVPWVGMGTAVVAILILFILVARGTNVPLKKEENLNE